MRQLLCPIGRRDISILDDSIDIGWQIPADTIFLYEKDTKHPLLKDFDNPFSVDVDLSEGTFTYNL